MIIKLNNKNVFVDYNFRKYVLNEINSSLVKNRRHVLPTDTLVKDFLLNYYQRICASRVKPLPNQCISSIHKYSFNGVDTLGNIVVQQSDVPYGTQHTVVLESAGVDLFLKKSADYAWLFTLDSLDPLPVENAHYKIIGIESKTY